VEAVPTTKKLAALLIEDNPDDADLLKITLRRLVQQPIELQHARTLAEGRRVLSQARFDFVLLDLSLPDVRGAQTVVLAREAAPEIPIIVLTGAHDNDLAAASLRAGAQDYLVKGKIDAHALARSIRYAIERMAFLQQQNLVSELQEALRRVKLLSGLVPICSCCKKIRDDRGYWEQLEQYIAKRSEAQFTHGICPECAEKTLEEYRQAHSS